MENINERLAGFVEHIGHSQPNGKGVPEVARKSGIDANTLRLAIKAGASKPSYDTISSILGAYPSLSPDWLLLGKGSMLRDSHPLPLVSLPAPRVAETAPVLAGEPQPDYTSATATQQTLYIELLKEQVADLKADKVRHLAEIDRLLGVGKLDDSSDAADESSEDPRPAPTTPTGQGVLPLPTLRVQRVRGLRSYDTEE